MPLLSALPAYQSDGLITGYRLLNEHKTTLDLPSGRAIVVAEAESDKVWAGTIRTIARDEPRPDFIVYERFEQVEDSALLQAQKMGMKLVTLRRFAQLLPELGR